MKVILIDGVKVWVVFNMNAMREFAKVKGIEFVSEIQDVFQGIDSERMRFEDMDTMAQITKCAIDEGSRVNRNKNGVCDTPEFSVEDVLNALFEDPDLLVEVIEELANGLVQKKRGDVVPNLKARGKTGAIRTATIINQ